MTVPQRGAQADDLPTAEPRAAPGRSRNEVNQGTSAEICRDHGDRLLAEDRAKPRCNFFGAPEVERAALGSVGSLPDLDDDRRLGDDAPTHTPEGTARLEVRRAARERLPHDLLDPGTVGVGVDACVEAMKASAAGWRSPRADEDAGDAGGSEGHDTEIVTQR